ncbi:inner membrane protein import complex subunit Tim54-domain-containing protein [Abortiporus biennis]|nr:inner membrane protein import complex subunit Tim54-domain-containing protein [Abortiporus biennis]
MSSNGGDSNFPTLKPPQSGVKTVLQYTGIPPSWLDKRPKLPSRNWLIFLSVTSSILGWYYYDHRECKKIRQEYVDKVKHLADVPLHSLDYPRKVTVYGTKWPADEDSLRSVRYFKKYVKPIFVAAAIDYEIISGRRYGDLANKIAEDIKTRRRIEAGLEQAPPGSMLLPNQTVEAKRRRELEGGIVIIGRPTFKEFMSGLKRGWTEGLEKVDKEEQLSNELSSDGTFDEPAEEDTSVDVDALDGEPIPTKSKLPPSKAFSPFTAPQLRAPPPPSPANVIPTHLNTPPASIPPMPPILLVQFINHIGLGQIPHMIYEFFNERHKVRSGAEAAYKLVMGETRPFIAPPPALPTLDPDFDVTTSPSQPHPSELKMIPTDLEFGGEAESYYKQSLVNSFASDIQKAREEYYKSLPGKLEVARSLARGTREPTKEEQSYPPPTEVELRAERIKKELRWRNDEQGWDVIKPEKDVEWDERFRGVLRVFVEPPSERTAVNTEETKSA